MRRSRSMAWPRSRGAASGIQLAGHCPDISARPVGRCLRVCPVGESLAGHQIRAHRCRQHRAGLLCADSYARQKNRPPPLPRAAREYQSDTRKVHGRPNGLGRGAPPPTSEDSDTGAVIKSLAVANHGGLGRLSYTAPRARYPKPYCDAAGVPPHAAALTLTYRVTHGPRRHRPPPPPYPDC